MYKRFDIIGTAEDLSEEKVFKDRMRYQTFIEAAEQFAATHDLIVGGPSATRLLLALPDSRPAIDLDSFRYDFYSGQASQKAQALGDAMYALDPQGLGHYTTVLSKVADYHFIVAVDGRDLFSITSLPVHRGVRTADVVIPSQRLSQFAVNSAGAPLMLQCMGPEIQLMNLYATLCNPGLANEWGESLAVETRLRALFGKEIRSKIAEAVKRVEGGRDEGGRDLIRALRDKYATGPDRVLIGPVAIAVLTGIPASSDRLQVVTAAPLEAEAQEIAAIAKRQGVEVQWTMNDPKIPTDSRLRRLTVYIVESRERREPVLDVYNAAAHELIPYITVGMVVGGRHERDGNRGHERDGNRGHERDGSRGHERDGSRGHGRDGSRGHERDGSRGHGRDGSRGHGRDGSRGHERDGSREEAPLSATLKIGTPFVLMRFRLADMWTMQVLMRMGAVKSGYAKSILHEMLSGYDAAAAFYEEKLQLAAADPEGITTFLMPASAYIGRLEDSDLALKRAALSRTGRFYPPYLPAARANKMAGNMGETGQDE